MTVTGVAHWVPMGVGAVERVTVSFTSSKCMGLMLIKLGEGLKGHNHVNFKHLL